jgi:hypothetical protein
MQHDKPIRNMTHYYIKNEVNGLEVNSDKKNNYSGKARSKTGNDDTSKPELGATPQSL